MNSFLRLFQELNNVYSTPIFFTNGCSSWFRNKYIIGPGGKGSNQAVAAAKSGSNVSFISKIGTDPYGELAKKIYKETNVGSKFVFISWDFDNF